MNKDVIGNKSNLLKLEFLLNTEVNISPKISICAQPLKMALHRNPAVHGSRMVIFLHDSKKALFSTIKSSFSAQFKRKLAKLARYHIIHCIAFYFAAWFGLVKSK